MSVSPWPYDVCSRLFSPFLRVALSDGNGADFDLAPRMRSELPYLDGGRGRQMVAQVGAPYAVEIVLLGHVGEEARCRDQIGERCARRLESFLEIFHAEDRLFPHGRRQVEFFLAMGMAVVDSSGGHAGEKNQITAADDDRRCVRHDDIVAAVGMMDNRDLLRHRSRSS